MNCFTIEPNEFLTQPIQAFYHSDYSPGQWRVLGTIENIICTLKNDITPYDDYVLQNASKQLGNILMNDLPQVFKISRKNKLTVCVVPRAKVNYRADQLLFRQTVNNVVSNLQGFINGTNYITRHADTKTTHRARGGYGGNGDMPYPNITNQTCAISAEVEGRDILLIDDLYTRTVNIDEDAIQALLYRGANSVVFYAVGKTISRF